jgi:hypothetical protein
VTNFSMLLRLPQDAEVSARMLLMAPKCFFMCFFVVLLNCLLACLLVWLVGLFISWLVYLFVGWLVAHKPQAQTITNTHTRTHVSVPPTSCLRCMESLQVYHFMQTLDLASHLLAAGKPLGLLKEE